MRKTILLIGGTGVVGSVSAVVALQYGFNVHTISLEKNFELPNAIQQHICDRNDRMAFRALVGKLNDVVGSWDIVFDIIGSKQRDAEQTCLLLGKYANRIFFLSTTLVYSRITNVRMPICSSAALALRGEMGGYVDSKVAMENFIQSREHVAWTIFRPYHILGRYSLLGCLPDHNRDPHLIERIKKGRPISLCENGDIPLQIIHPRDIAIAFIKASIADITIHHAYNLVNPLCITAFDYYNEIAKQLNCELKISRKALNTIWDEQKGWELTTFPHVYDISDLKKHINFVPSISLNKAVNDALNSPKISYENMIDIPVHNRMTLLPRPKRAEWLFHKKKFY